MMKKSILVSAVIAVVVLLVIGTVGYLLSSQTEYSGYFDIVLNGVDCKLELTNVERIQNGDKIIYRTSFSGGGKSADVSFALWKDQDNVYIDLDNPTIQINGKNYWMSRALRKSDFSLNSVTEHSLNLAFYEVPYSDGFKLNAIMYLQVFGGKLY